MGIIGLIVALVGFVGGIVLPFVFPTMGAIAYVFVAICVAGIVLSAIGMKKGSNHRGCGIAGLVIAIVGVICSLIIAVACHAGKVAMDAVENGDAQGMIDEISSELGTVEGGEELVNQLQEIVDEVQSEATGEAEAAAETEAAAEETVAETEAN